ncbi:MAG: class I SAM-dependent methyltransferase [Actinomycetota bacterium]|nr:class I SAM-dependent methyltransferase [Actinomycetota bacterium]
MTTLRQAGPPFAYPLVRSGRRRVLDVGSAGGAHSFSLADGAALVVALDLSRAELQRLADKTPSGGERVVVLQADATDLPFPDGSFDEAALYEVLEHVKSPARVLAECCRVLRPGGIFTMSVPTAYTERVYWRLHPSYEQQSTHLRIFELEEVVTLLSEAGFEVRRQETAHFAPMLAWFVHCLLRTPADHTGAVLRNRFVDVAVAKAVGIARRLPLVGAVVRFLSCRFGKSWWFACAKLPAL